MTRYAAVDLGASSGRVIAGRVTGSVLDVEEVHRFDNEPVRLPDGLHWDVLGLYREVRRGLALAGPIRSAGIDSWAVDYGLLDAEGALLGLPYHYRDNRNLGPRKAPANLYDITGIADLPFNTIHQLLAEPAARLGVARQVLLMPDLLGYWLTGVAVAERTNASTTGLLDPRTGRWDAGLATLVGIDPSILAPIAEPGTTSSAWRAWTSAASKRLPMTYVPIAFQFTMSENGSSSRAFWSCSIASSTRPCAIRIVDSTTRAVG